MRRNKSDLIRVQNMLESERVNCRADFREIFKLDLIKLLNEYFLTPTDINLELEKIGAEQIVKIEFKIGGVKAFNYISQDNF